MKQALIGLCLVVAVSGCNSVPYPQDRDTFLKTNDPRWSIWLDTVIYANLNGTPMSQFRRTKGLGFGRTPLILLGSAPQLEPIIIQGYGCTIREFLWRIHRKYGFVIDLITYKGKIHLRVRSPQVVKDTSPKGR